MRPVVSRTFQLSCVGLITALVLGHAVMQAQSEPARKTVFANLEEADARAHAASRIATSLQARVAKHDKNIQDTLEELDVTRRATEKLRRELVAQHIDWDRSLRQLERGRGRSVGARQRLSRLMQHASPSAMALRQKEHAIVSALDHGERRIRALVGQQGNLIVELAQQRASQGAAQAEHDSTLKEARQASAEVVARDLEATDSRLTESMGTLDLKNPSTRDFHRYKGTLIPPVKQAATHTYGPRKQRASSSYVRHTGYTYMIDVGTSVRAVASGLVVHAERFEGFGILLIIDHGTGYHTLYAHLDELQVRAGDRVKKGDTIALSGESGSLDGPKLYFELRQKGKPIDPSDWFIRF